MESPWLSDGRPVFLSAGSWKDESRPASRYAQMFAIGAAENDMAAAAMQPFNAQAVGNALNVLNSSVSRVLPHFL